MTQKDMKRYLLLIPIVALLAACAATAPRTFEHEVAVAEQLGDKYNADDWKRVDEHFDRFCQYYNYDRLQTMSEEEQREVGRLMARYAKVRAKAAAKEIGGALKTGATLLGGFLEELGFKVDNATEINEEPKE